MFQLGKTIHVLALGYWFGSTAFFVLMAASLIGTFETIGASSHRPNWFPVAEGFKKKDTNIKGPTEQGSRAFGAAVGPLFPWFFLLQGIAGFLAVATCLGWTRTQPPAKVHRIRAYLLLAALVTVLIGWAVGQKVEELRVPRNQATDAYLSAAPGQADSLLPIMESARAEFTRWHFYSLGLSFVTLLLVTAAMALAARLPAAPVVQAASPNGAKAA